VIRREHQGIKRVCFRPAMTDINAKPWTAPGGQNRSWQWAGDQV